MHNEHHDSAGGLHALTVPVGPEPVSGRYCAGTVQVRCRYCAGIVQASSRYTVLAGTLIPGSQSPSLPYSFRDALGHLGHACMHQYTVPGMNIPYSTCICGLHTVHGAQY